VLRLVLLLATPWPMPLTAPDIRALANIWPCLVTSGRAGRTCRLRRRRCPGSSPQSRAVGPTHDSVSVRR